MRSKVISVPGSSCCALGFAAAASFGRFFCGSFFAHSQNILGWSLAVCLSVTESAGNFLKVYA